MILSALAPVAQHGLLRLEQYYQLLLRLESAVATPRASFGGEYLHSTIAEMAAALMFALISNHGFVDGNKRVGTLAALVFRQVNGRADFPPAVDLESIAMACARGELTREELAHWWLEC